jgi:UDP-N-acetylmuramoylalanine--D-glutamate ligase
MLAHLATVQWSPHIALITMIGQDHLDWHGGLDGYVAAKKTILQFQRRDDYAIINENDEASIKTAEVTPARVVYFGLKGRKPFALKLPGAHNQLNAQAAFATANCLGVSWDQAQDAIKDFPGLPHRLQLVHAEGGVRYVNDSIATIPQAAVAALESFPPHTVLQIVGGYDKHLDTAALIQALSDRAKAVLCIGATGPALAAELAKVRTQGSPPVFECHDLATAMKIAKENVRAGDTILLSTGCASYDQFPNFEKRGELFAELACSET